MIKSKYQLDEKESRFNTERNKLLQAQTRMDEMQVKLVSETEMLEKLEGQKNVLNERQKYAKDNAEDLKERITKLEEKYEAGQASLSQEQALLLKEEKKAKAFKNEVKQKEERLHFLSEDLDEVLDRLKSEYFDILNQQTSVKNEAGYLNSRLDQLVHKREHLSSQTDGLPDTDKRN